MSHVVVTGGYIGHVLQSKEFVQSKTPLQDCQIDHQRSTKMKLPTIKLLLAVQSKYVLSFENSH